MVTQSYYMNNEFTYTALTFQVVHYTAVAHTAIFEAKKWENREATENESGHLNN